MRTATALYGLYRADEFVDVGTARELAERHNVKEETVRFWSTPCYHKRAENATSNKKDGGESIRIIAVKIPKEDEDDDTLWSL